MAAGDLNHGFLDLFVTREVVDEFLIGVDGLVELLVFPEVVTDGVEGIAGLGCAWVMLEEELVCRDAFVGIVEVLGVDGTDAEKRSACHVAGFEFLSDLFVRGDGVKEVAVDAVFLGAGGEEIEGVCAPDVFVGNRGRFGVRVILFAEGEVGDEDFSGVECAALDHDASGVEFTESSSAVLIGVADPELGVIGETGVGVCFDEVLCEASCIRKVLRPKLCGGGREEAF